MRLHKHPVMLIECFTQHSRVVVLLHFVNGIIDRSKEAPGAKNIRSNPNGGRQDRRFCCRALENRTRAALPATGYQMQIGNVIQQVDGIRGKNVDIVIIFVYLFTNEDKRDGMFSHLPFDPVAPGSGKQENNRDLS